MEAGGDVDTEQWEDSTGTDSDTAGPHHPKNGSLADKSLMNEISNEDNQVNESDDPFNYDPFQLNTSGISDSYAATNTDNTQLL